MTPVYQTDFVLNIRGAAKCHNGGTILFTGDAQSISIRVSVYDGPDPAPVSGIATARAVRADGRTVEIDGLTVSGNVVTATLPASCYVVPGRLDVSIRVTSGDTKTTVLYVTYSVISTTTDEIVDPGHVIPDVSDIIAEYATMQQAVADANSATTAANTAAQNANAAAASIPAALDGIFDADYSPALTSGQYVMLDGQIKNYVGYSRTDYIPVTAGGVLGVLGVPAYTSGDSGQYNVFYDANREYVANFTVSPGSNSVPVPASAAYAILSGKTGRMEAYRLEGRFPAALFSENLLYVDIIPGSTSSVAFDASGRPSTITHTIGGRTVRTDTIAYGANAITETRTDGARTVTITTNLTTLQTEVS